MRQDYERVQQLYSHSLRQAAAAEMQRIFGASTNASATFKQLAHLLAQPSLRHPMATPGLKVVLAELGQCGPGAYAQFASDMLTHMRHNYGRQAAAAEHTLKVERLLETIQQRTLDRMKQQQSDM